MCRHEKLRYFLLAANCFRAKRKQLPETKCVATNAKYRITESNKYFRNKFENIQDYRKKKPWLMKKKRRKKYWIRFWGLILIIWFASRGFIRGDYSENVFAMEIASVRKPFILPIPNIILVSSQGLPNRICISSLRDQKAEAQKKIFFSTHIEHVARLDCSFPFPRCWQPDKYNRPPTNASRSAAQATDLSE